jgi:hypothetical protein
MFDLQQLMTDIAEGFPLLLVGSGYSAAAVNATGDHLPTGGQLSHLLQDALGLAKLYPLDVLAREYKLASGEHGLLELLHTRLTATSITDSQRYIANLGWHRIYTTNYDNVVELALDGSVPRAETINVPLSREVSFSSARLPIIHVNGVLAGADIRNFDEAIRLTRASYLTESFLSSNWLAQFRRDVSLASAILVVGYSVSDIDLARILYADPTIRQRLFFLDAVDLDPILRRELEQFGTVLDVGLDAFVNQSREVAVTPRQQQPLHSFSEYSRVTPAEAATGDDVTKLLLYGDYNPAIQVGSVVEDKLYAIERSCVQAVLERLQSGARRFVLHSDLGNGKSIAIDQLRDALVRRSFRIFSLTQYDEYVEDDLRVMANAESLVIIVEDLFRNTRAIEKIVAAFPDAPIILSTRSAIFELQSDRLTTLLGPSYLLFDLNSLDGFEISQLIQLFETNGLWADLASRRPADKLDFVQRTCGRQLRTVLIRLFESPTIRAKIISTFKDVASSDALAVLTVSLLLDIAGFYPDLYILNQLSGIDVFLARDKINNAFSLEFLDQKHGSVRVKSPLLGEYVLQNVVSGDYVLSKLIDCVNRCEDARVAVGSRGDLFGEIQKEMMRFSFVDRVFARKRAGDAYKRYYDSIKDLPSMARNPQFWLQYAIARLEDADFRASLIHFRTAYSHAKPKGASYDTFQIDNHYARFLIVSRTQDPSFKDDFKVFLEAHQLLITQARKDKEAYYNYKVAREYVPFYKARVSGWHDQQKEIFARACQEIMSQIETVPSTVKKYYVIDECYADLRNVVEEIDHKRGR